MKTTCSFILLGLLVACVEVGPLPAERKDDGGAYTVSAQQVFTLGELGISGELSTQALATHAPTRAGLVTLALPVLSAELRNYASSITGDRSRGVVTLRWPGEVPLAGTVRVEVVGADSGERLASFGTAAVEGAATFTTPYLHQPNERLCVSLEADVRASTPQGDALAFSLRQRVCEAETQRVPQDTVLASRSIVQDGVTTTAELRYLGGVGHRALVRYEAAASSAVSGRLCLHEQGKASCRRSSSTSASFSGGGVAEFVTSYHASSRSIPSGGLAGLELCAGVPGVGACSSGEVELLKRHVFRDGINTNVTLLETAEGVVARVRFSVPKGVTLREYNYLDFVHGHDYEAFFSLSDGAGIHTGSVVPTTPGPAERVLETDPLPSGGERYCFHLGVPYSLAGEYPKLIEMEGCTD